VGTARLKAQGMSYAAIARRMGDWSSGPVLQRAMARHLRTHPSLEIEPIRAESEARLLEVIRQAFSAIRAMYDSDYSPVTIARHLPPLLAEVTRADAGLRRLTGADQPARLNVKIGQEYDPDIEAPFAQIDAGFAAGTQHAEEAAQLRAGHLAITAGPEG